MFKMGCTGFNVRLITVITQVVVDNIIATHKKNIVVKCTPLFINVKSEFKEMKINHMHKSCTNLLKEILYK